jgi:predicted small integral membrane protein
MNMQWMAWTPVTAWFFVCIGLILVTMTFWQMLCPTVPRKGFLPMVTTRGDRLFIGLLGSAYIHLAWIGLVTAPLYFATLISVCFLALVIWKG